MKTTGYETIKNKFLEKYEEQKSKYEGIELKYKEITNDSFDNINKMLKYCGSRAIVYSISYGLCTALITYLMKVITLPLWILPVIYISPIIIIGIIAKKIRTRNTSTFKGKYIEEIKLLIELEKIKKRESIFYSVYMTLNTISKMTEKCDFREKEENITIERLQTIIEQEKDSIEECYKNIDLLITKNILCNDSKLYRAKTLNIPTLTYFLMILGVAFIIGSPLKYISNQVFYGLYTILSVISSIGLVTLFVPNKLKKINAIIIELRKQYLINDEYKENINLDEKIKELTGKIVEKEIELAKYECGLNSLTIQTTNLKRKRILPRKEVVSNNLLKRKILGIKKLDNKRYY